MTLSLWVICLCIFCVGACHGRDWRQTRSKKDMKRSETPSERRLLSSSLQAFQVSEFIFFSTLFRMDLVTRSSLDPFSAFFYTSEFSDSLSFTETLLCFVNKITEMHLFEWRDFVEWGAQNCLRWLISNISQTELLFLLLIVLLFADECSNSQISFDFATSSEYRWLFKFVIYASLLSLPKALFQTSCISHTAIF